MRLGLRARPSAILEVIRYEHTIATLNMVILSQTVWLMVGGKNLFLPLDLSTKQEVLTINKHLSHPVFINIKK